MPSNYKKDDPILGTIDLDDEYITDAWLVDQFGGTALYSFGRNFVGELGNGNSISYSSPIQVGSLTNWKEIGCVEWTSIGIKTDGTLWTWGTGGYGRLGNGTVSTYDSPIQIGALTDWKSISNSSHGFHMLAVKTNGTLWVWGRNQFGQLGNGTVNIDYSSPIQVGTSTNWSQVSSGYGHTGIITKDNALWTWGYNNYGQLGNGNTVYYSSPIQVGSLTNWKQVSCGYYHTAAIKTDGTLWTWGYNQYGQLGNGTSVNRYSSPIQIGSLNNWKQVSAGNGHTAAIKTDGTLWTWGYNDFYGQLGNGNTTGQSSPIQIGLLNNWKQVRCVSQYTAAIKTDGTLWTWGYSNYGQLGNGTSATSYSSPIQIGSLTNWRQVATSPSHVVALTFQELN